MKSSCPIRQRHGNFACGPCRENPGVGVAPVECPEGFTLASLPRGLGDALHSILKPVARLLRSPCLGPDGKLRPESPCGKRVTKLNGF